MCRLLAYLGDDILLSRLVLEPEHSLEKQAWQPKELREVKLNADGFGFAWYNNSKKNSQTPALYRQVLPIWNDPNLYSLANTLSQPLWLAMVRSATPGLGVSLENTQPFCHQQWSFVHNGYILDFSGETQHKLRDLLTNEFLYLIKGNTDSEYIFALLMQHLATEPPHKALSSCMQTLHKIVNNKRSLLNILLSDGINIYATCHAINGLSPTLYYTNSSDEFGEGNQLLVSEKLNHEPHWQSIEEHKIVSIHPDKSIGIIDL